MKILLKLNRSPYPYSICIVTQAVMDATNTPPVMGMADASVTLLLYAAAAAAIVVAVVVAAEVVAANC